MHRIPFLVFFFGAVLSGAGCGTNAKTHCAADLDCLHGDTCGGGQCQGNADAACGPDYAVCASDAMCATTGDGFACACKPGYAGDGITCSRDTACGPNDAVCASDATCASTGDSFACTCNPGYVGDGLTCSRDTTTLHVSPTGADDNDGISAPVKTLKQAISLAARDGQIRTIELAEGRYDKLRGEEFPYMIPVDVTLRGPATGVALLAGAHDTPGLVFDASRIEHLELANFTIALDAIGAGSVEGVRVHDSDVGLQLESDAKVMATGLAIDLSENPGRKIGVQLAVTAELTAVGLETTDLATHLIINPSANVKLTAPRIQGGGVGVTVAGGVLDVTDGVIAAGTTGLVATGSEITLTSTTISGASGICVSVGTAQMQITGGEIRDCGTGLDVSRTGQTQLSPTVTVQGVHFTGNVRAASFSGQFLPMPVTVRGSTFEGNTIGIVIDATTIDLGTPDSPGTNDLRSGLSALFASSAANVINAVGNHWLPDVQEADTQGHYSTRTIIGPASGGNYTLRLTERDITNPNPRQWQLNL